MNKQTSKGRPRPKVKHTLMKLAQKYCDRNDKSTEFMLEYIQDYANVDLDTVIEFLREQEYATA